MTTDGPLLSLALDADRRWDSKNLVWHDAAQTAENDDGRMGGDGPLDGAFTALVRRGSDAPAFRYRYSSSPEFGPVAAVLLYKTEAGNSNPTRSRGSHDQIVGVKIDGKNFALFIDNNKGIVGTLATNAAGMNEARSYTFTYDGNGNVTKAVGVIFRENKDGKFEAVGRFEFITGEQLNSIKGEYAQHAAISAAIADATAVYQEFAKDDSGKEVMTQRVFLGRDANGDVTVLVPTRTSLPASARTQARLSRRSRLP